MRILFSIIVLFSISVSVPAVDLTAEINAATEKVMPQVIQWRRYFHEHPELGMQETQTAGVG